MRARTRRATHPTVPLTKDELERLTRHYLESGIARSTRATYTVAQRQYIDFCMRFQYEPLPASEHTLCVFATWLTRRLCPKSIQVYMFGVRSLHIEQGFGNPIEGRLMLQRVMRGIRISYGDKRQVKRFPIATDIVDAIRPWVNFYTYEGALLWAVICVAVGGLFRIGELTSLDRSPDPVRLLTFANLTWSSDYTSFTIFLRASKTDPFRNGATVLVAWPTAVSAMKQYLKLRGPQPAHATLFATREGYPVLRRSVLSATKLLLMKARINTVGYEGISFRRGGATSLARNGTPDYVIQEMGRWLSGAYRRYIEADHSVILKYAQHL